MTDGPLLRAMHFDYGDDEPGRLLLAIHHLAVDGVSWRILMEDLESAYLSLRRGQCRGAPAENHLLQALVRDAHRPRDRRGIRRDRSTAGARRLGRRRRALPSDHDGGENLEETARRACP